MGWLWATANDVERAKQAILKEVNQMAENVNDLTVEIEALTAQVEKIGGEVDALQAALVNVPLPQAAKDALAKLTAAVQAVDEKNPDNPA